jgi:TfoX/Sxy family transcriptional regulator of competence genes
MFGGLAFLVSGNMAIAASRQGGILLRVDPAEADRLLDTTNAEVAVMRNRPMHGWLRVAPEHLGTKRQLAKWVRLATGYAHSLPPKR